MLLLGKEFPNFEAKTTEGEIIFHQWLGESWGILISHSSAFNPICTTELAQLIKLMPEFEKRNVKVLALSCDDTETHCEWIKDIKVYASYDKPGFPFPIIEDSQRRLALTLGMLDLNMLDESGIPLTSRGVFIVDPKKKYRLSMMYPATTGRCFNEVLRAIDSLQVTEKAKIATPADWIRGQQCMVQTTVPRDRLNEVFPMCTKIILPSGKDYFIKTPSPIEGVNK